jgi:hypothetical protein
MERTNLTSGQRLRDRLRALAAEHRRTLRFAPDVTGRDHVYRRRR